MQKSKASAVWWLCLTSVVMEELFGFPIETEVMQDFTFVLKINKKTD